VTRPRFAAWLAPLGVPSGDGRVIDPAALVGHPAPPRHAYLIVRTQIGGLRLGAVDEVMRRGGWLVASGPLFANCTRTERAALEQIRSGVLRPQMELWNTGMETQFDEDGEGPPLLRFTSGMVTAVVAGQDPAWPDCRFSLEES
jgi:hypothetical protein